MEDRIFRQEISPGQIGYSRGISAVGKDFIMRHYDAYGGTKPPPIDHLGIEDSFLEKGFCGLVLLRTQVAEVERSGLRSHLPRTTVHPAANDSKTISRTGCDRSTVTGFFP
jgi:hypothetical protein